MKDRLITTLCIGEEAESLSKSSVPLMERYAERCRADFKVLGGSDNISVGEEYYEKFQIRDLLDQYQRVLFIDLDILVNPLSPDLFELVPEDSFGATSVDGVLRKIPEEKRSAQRCFGDLEWSSPYFNAGVMMFGQLSKPMLDFCISNRGKWIKFMIENKLKVFHDQTLLNYSLNFNGPTFVDLGPSFNFTRAWKQFDKRFSQNFIHYAGLTGNRDWQMYRDSQIFSSKVHFWLYRNSSSATWFFDRLCVIWRSALGHR